MSRTTNDKHDAADKRVHEPVPGIFTSINEPEPDANGDQPSAEPARNRTRRIRASFDEDGYDTVLRAVALKLAILGITGRQDEEQAGRALACICGEWNRHQTARLARQESESNAQARGNLSSLQLPEQGTS